MGLADKYKYLAAKVLERAVSERNRAVKAGWRSLAQAYLRLAEHCEKKERGNDRPDRRKA